jgi:hypothetical protein
VTPDLDGRRAVADLLVDLGRLTPEDYLEFMTTLCTKGAREGFTVVSAEAMVVRMCDVAVEFRFMPALFWNTTEEVQREVQAFVQLLEQDGREGPKTLALGFICLLHLLVFVEGRYGGFVDHTEPDKIALPAQIHQEVKGVKRPGWRRVYSRWTKHEPRLKRWCKNFNVLRVTYHRAIKEHRFPL